MRKASVYFMMVLSMVITVPVIIPSGKIVNAETISQVEDELDAEVDKKDYDEGDDEYTNQIAAKATSSTEEKIYYDKETILELLDGINSIDDIIEGSGYEEKENMNVQDFATGDIMINDNEAYIFVETKKLPNKWEIIKFSATGDKPIIEESEVSYTEESRYFKWKKQSPVYEAPVNLQGIFGDPLSTVILPDGFVWNNPDIKMQSAGEWTYAAIYTPENKLKYNDITVMVKVNVNKKEANITSPVDKYTLTYTPGLSIDVIPLPAGWKFDTKDKELDIGTYSFKAVFEGDPNYEYVGSTEKTIKVDVKKNNYKITGATINAFKGSVLTDDMLPVYNNGKLSWDVQGVTVYESGSFKCTFYPNDTTHYNNTSDIIVFVNAIPASQNSSNVSVPDDEDNEYSDIELDDEDEDSDSQSTAGSKNKKPKKTTEKQKDTDTKQTEKTATVSDGQTNNDPSHSSVVVPDTTAAQTTEQTQQAATTTEKEDTLDITTVSDVSEKDIKKTKKTSTDSNKTNTNVAVKDLKVTKTEKEEQTETKLKNINLAQAETKPKDNASTESKTTTENGSSTENQGNTDKKEKNTEEGERYTEDPEVKKYEAPDLEPDTKEDSTSEEGNVDVTWDDEGKKQNKETNNKNKAIVIVMSVIASVIGVATYFFLKKRKFRK